MKDRIKQFATIVFPMFVIALWLQLAPGCSDRAASDATEAEVGLAGDELQLDPATGIPYAPVFQIPIKGFTTSDFGFGFGAENKNFCMEWSSGQCMSYGAHLGRDTLVQKTPVGTEVFAPADGIVRVTTDRLFGGYGADSASNPNYDGCLVVLEHEFPNGQAVTSLLGHIMCEKASPYDASQKTGNPAAGTIVRRGQYVGHVRPYYHGATTSIVWSHLHWGMRRGRFVASSLGEYVKGYAKRSEFTKDPTTGALEHSDWIDPFVVVAANGDPAALAASGVLFHPSGALLEDSLGNIWVVTGATSLAPISHDVFDADRYDLRAVVHATDDELSCYTKTLAPPALGRVTLYQRPGSSTVVMALDDARERYDFVRWEALLSWGFDASDIKTDSATATLRESTYTNRGLRRLRPGTLVKADETTEVSIVTWQGTRVPIASGDVFEALGFSWQEVVSVPQEVLDATAGPRESTVLDWIKIHTCAVAPSCPDGGTCGGGGSPDLDAGVDAADTSEARTTQKEICNGLDDDGNGQVDEIFQCVLGAVNGPTCITSCNTAGQRICEAPTCSWGTCRPMAESCANTIDDDCNGLIDCQDPACASASNCVAKPDAGMTDTGSTSGTLVTFSYTGPLAPGYIWVEGWWQPPAQFPRVWDKIAECADPIPGDGKLDCSFTVPRYTSPLEFQVYLPDGRYWGDESYDPLGGHGTTIGTVTLSTAAGSLPYTMISKDGKPYYMAHVASVP